jgi:HD domain
MGVPARLPSSAMGIAPLPRSIAGLPVPHDAVSAATWRWAQSSLPRYLLAHSVRSYCWGAEIALEEGWTFDAQVLWTAALFHDVGLTRIPRNTMCFEVEGAEIARAFLEAHGMSPEAADRAAIAIILHMQPGVTLSDGVEAVLLDRATGIDVRGVDYDVIGRVRSGVVRKHPRGAFDRHFLRAIEREVGLRPSCQSARLLADGKLAESMAHSPWAVA